MSIAIRRAPIAAAVVGACLACGPRETPAPRGPTPSPAAPDAAVSAPPPPEPTPTGKLPADVRPLAEALDLAIDPSAQRFGGTATIELELDQPRAVLFLHGRGLAVSRVEVTSGSTTVAGAWEEVDPTGVARVTIGAPVAGRATLRIEFDAPYDAQLTGVYRVVRGGDAGVFTKFEAIYARRGFPCFDEPRFKVPFDVTLRAPVAHEVVGNMPVAERTVTGATQRVRFERTPPLPTYLVAFAVGPFDVRTASVPPTPVRAAPLPIRAVAWRGRGDATSYILGATPAVIAEQERYFGIAFPYPKLDLIAAPEHQSGAMENAGAIIFRDAAMLVEDRVTSFSQRVNVLGVLAHETAHQWFGDLVTMPWWNDLWLNEGFATFLATRTLRAIRPELEAELHEAQETSDVMYADSLASARRIRQPIESTHDITNAFDGITYDKGAAFLTMIERHIGEDAFRRGVTDYLRRHALGGATTDDLLAALAKASGTDLAPIASSFLDRPGVPVVTVRATCEAGAGRVLLEQARWQPVGATLASGDPWRVPVCVRAGHAGRIEEKCTLLTERTGAIELPTCVDWVMPNARAAGYYRTAQSPAELARLRDQGLAKLTTVERLAVAHNIEAAFRSGALTGGELVQALEAIARDAHGAIAAAPLDVLRFIDAHVVEGAARTAMRARIAALYAPAVRALGWRPAATEPASRRTFRTRLLQFLALTIEDPATLGEAARLGRRYLGLDGDRQLHPEVVDPDLAGLVIAAAARRGDAAVFDALLGHLGRAEDAQLRARLIAALASTRVPALVARALDLALDAGLRPTERLGPIFHLGASIDTRDAAWTWLEANFDKLAPLLPDRYAARIPAMFAACDPTRGAALEKLFGARADKLTGAPRSLALALEGIAQCAARVAAHREGLLGAFARK